MPAPRVIQLSQLRIGLYISFELDWSKHAFFSNEFKIATEADLRALRNLPLEYVTYDPAKSDVEPLPLPAKRVLADPKVRAEAIRKRRTDLKQCEAAFGKTANEVRSIMTNLRSNPREAVAGADTLIGTMVTSLLASKESILQVINMKGKDQSTYYHAINVSTLCLLLGKALGLSESSMQLLGVGAMLHDIGMIEVPGQIQRKQEPLTSAEQHIYRQHTTNGLRLAQRLNVLAPEVMEVIGSHHELMDGSGYPKGIKADRLSPITRIVTLVNAYDNLCNPINPALARTPFEAMSILYRQGGKLYDMELVTGFITNMGVYPPGTVVKMADGSLGMVVTVNQQSLLKPTVLIYDPRIPKEEGILVNLAEEALEVTEALPRSRLSPEVQDYLNLQDSVNYFMQTEDHKA